MTSHCVGTVQMREESEIKISVKGFHFKEKVENAGIQYQTCNIEIFQ